MKSKYLDAYRYNAEIYHFRLGLRASPTLDRRRHFNCYMCYIDWYQVSLGVSIDFKMPNIEFHLPCCFVKVGWTRMGLAMWK